MSVLGTVAVYIKSESGDSYLFCFEKESVSDINEELIYLMDDFSPIGDYEVAGNDPIFTEQVNETLKNIYKKSWE